MTKKKKQDLTQDLTGDLTLEPRFIPLQELFEKGYLQEVNRQFFHPMGLSLAFIEGDDPRLVVYDFRYTPYGPLFSPEVLQNPKFIERKERIELECAEKLLERQMTLGFGIQVPYVNQQQSMSRIRIKPARLR